MEEKHFNLNWDTLWRVFFMVLLAWVFFSAIEVVAGILLAIVISTAFSPVVTFFQKKFRIPRVLGALVLYLAAIFIFALMIYTLVPVVLAEFSNVVNLLPKILGNNADVLNIQEFLKGITTNINKVADLLFSGNVSFLGITSKILGGFLYVVAVFAISFYLTIGKDGVEKFFLAILPTAYEEKFLHIYSRASKKISGWLLGQLFLSLIVGILTFIGLSILGVKYSFLLALLAALFEIIPFVGPILTGAIGVLIALTTSLELGIYTLILFFVIQQLENHTLVPLVMRYTTALNPVVVLASVMAGGALLGVIGLALGVPVAVFLEEALDTWTDAKQKRKTNSLGL